MKKIQIINKSIGNYPDQNKDGMRLILFGNMQINNWTAAWNEFVERSKFFLKQLEKDPELINSYDNIIQE